MKKCWCGNENLKEYSSEYYQCDSCHTLISKNVFEDAVYDVQNEEKDLYGKNYWEVSMTKAAGKNTLSEVVDMYLTERVVYWLKYILRYVKLGANVAEVGCGLGQLQYVLKRLNYTQKAFELSADICSYMERELQVDTQCGSFVEQKDTYDGILAFDLFEHLNEPENFLVSCTNSLHDRGVLVFQTPCYDSSMDYDEMRIRAPRFQEQLKAEQHIYLYSKESIAEILKKHGFTNIIFEPAFFGDDYDMFLLASKDPICENSEEEVDQYLNSVPNGRIVKAMIKLFDEKNQIEKERVAIDTERNKMLQNVNILTETINEKNNQIIQATNAAADRLKVIEGLTADNEALKKVADEQLAEIAKLHEYNAVLQQAADERMAIAERLVAENATLEQRLEKKKTVVEKIIGCCRKNK